MRQLIDRMYICRDESYTLVHIKSMKMNNRNRLFSGPKCFNFLLSQPKIMLNMGVKFFDDLSFQALRQIGSTKLITAT